MSHNESTSDPVKELESNLNDSIQKNCDHLPKDLANFLDIHLKHHSNETAILKNILDAVEKGLDEYEHKQAIFEGAIERLSERLEGIEKDLHNRMNDLQRQMGRQFDTNIHHIVNAPIVANKRAELLVLNQRAATQREARQPEETKPSQPLSSQPLHIKPAQQDKHVTHSSQQNSRTECMKCHEQFPSRNKLMNHLRSLKCAKKQKQKNH
ncbi:hypothetical protein F4804DRAFT_348316 [Jackrogersella minutella]|nr:hypothetical protein F4804DRAFT_348316 [Jackrogersella minutella]